MSLEHDFNVNDDKVLGNFYVSGEYKVHEISINKEPFNYTLPFTVELRDDIDLDSLEFNIEDFSYNIKDENILKVNIEYSLKADEKIEENIEIEDGQNRETTFEKVNEDELDSELSFIDDFLDKEKEGLQENRELNETSDVKENAEEKDETIVEKEVKKETLKEEKQVVEVNNEEERNTTEIEEKTIMDTIKDSDDTFVTYHIHIVKENETLESISLIYNVPKTLLEDYNQSEVISIGDKILIPQIDE